jgi:LmbE family N-acetylglucosaminyl deacetylase
VARIRETELRAAAAALGIREVSVLSYPDGAVDKVKADLESCLPSSDTDV